MPLEYAYRECQQVIMEHSKTFYKAFSLLPREKRNAVWAVYTFCRTVDDIVDEGQDALRELAQFEAEFRAFLSGSFSRGNAMWVALEDVFRRFEMDPQPFWEMIAGQRMDLVKMRYEAYEELLDYSYHVASTVGLMLLPILAPKQAVQLKPGAIALGLAMQITNILRDIGEDWERGRIYVPAELLELHGYTAGSLQAGEVNTAFITLWEDLARRAEVLYEEALASMHLYPLTSRLPVEGAARLYRAILPEIRKQGYTVFGQKHYVTDEAKQEILALMKEKEREVI
ncbi:phytoene/squalene synthase family protein [Ectobacillus sp. SYSU M60031]|uniref:Phytoene/squalene synthase family protein n=1 Tax=Ectobacillus ponti TaxID=2961894 RepID=A0AA41X7F9_9BACI|nr:phytoene/squalene synthase family protein [Ectobacillus ponti]